MFKSLPTVAVAGTGNTLVGSQTKLANVTVSADAKGDVQLRQLIFSVATTSVTVTAFHLDGPSGNTASTTANAFGITGAQTIVFTLDSTSNTSDRVVAANGSRTYGLYYNSATGISATAGASSLSASLQADTAYPGLVAGVHLSDTSTTSIAAANIIWSPISTSTSGSVAIVDNDWTNGYGVPLCGQGLAQNCPSVSIKN